MSFGAKKLERKTKKKKDFFGGPRCCAGRGASIGTWRRLWGRDSKLCSGRARSVKNPRQVVAQGDGREANPYHVLVC